MIIHVTLTEDQKQSAARELDLNSLLRIVLAKTMVNDATMEIASKIHEYLKNEANEKWQQEKVKTLEIETVKPQDQQEQQTIREYIINHDLNFWQNRFNKLKEITAPDIILQSIQEEINNLKSDKLALKTGKKLSESPAINPVIKKVEGDYVLIEFDCEKSTRGKIEYCRKNVNRYVRNK